MLAPNFLTVVTIVMHIVNVVYAYLYAKIMFILSTPVWDLLQTAWRLWIRDKLKPYLFSICIGSF